MIERFSLEKKKGWVSESAAWHQESDMVHFGFSPIAFEWDEHGLYCCPSA